ncbi:MBL fold metallo-hydrolase [Fretibacter rubidus]|uniref:MBL fold metallo-hydrolase n=1 Tax=Fretibacter rubidus TaxID=570162 RepID=UPI00352A2AD9
MTFRLSVLLSALAALSLSACSAQKTAPDTLAAEISANYPVVIQNIAEGVWVHTSAYTLPGGNSMPSNGLIVADGEELTLVDTAWGEMATQSLLQKIETEIGKPVKNLVLTAHTYDRLAGVDIIERAGAKVFTHPDTAGLAAKRGTPVPNTSVSALSEPRSRSKVGAVEIAFPGAGHTADNLVVYVPSHNVLFAGGLVVGAEMKGLGNTVNADIKAWPSALAWTKSVYKDAKIIVPANGKGGDLSLIDKTLQTLATEVNRLNEEQKRISAETLDDIDQKRISKEKNNDIK